jgi:hypothetical protein
LCFSYQFIEQQASDMCEKIRENSIYKFVRVEFSQSDSEELQKEGSALISKVILEDKEGTLYYVSPNPNGLKFAQGEITYKEYKKYERKETQNVLLTLLIGSVCLMILMGTLMRLIV